MMKALQSRVSLKTLEGVLETLYFLVYHALWRILLFLTNLEFIPWSEKIKAYRNERRWPQLVWLPRKNKNLHTATGRCLWFHASSGEIEYIKPLLRVWRERHPEDRLFLTYFSTSARPMIQQIPELDGWAPLPYDLPSPCRSFIDALKPDALLISRTDLWPCLLRELPATTPKVLLASTWSEGTQKTKGWGLIIARWCLPKLNKICVVSAKDHQVLEDLLQRSKQGEIKGETKATLQGAHRHTPSDTPHGHGARQNKPSIAVTKDPRFDQVEYRLQMKRPLPSALTEWAQDSFVFIAGSTWPEDEIPLLAAWPAAALSKARLLIVPHETDAQHLSELKTRLNEAQLPFQLWSELLGTNPNSAPRIKESILIFDRKGWLADLYRLAHLAFVGGSFRKQVHSVMEALGVGLPVVLGPFYQNNREAISFSELSAEQIPFVEIARDHESLSSILKKHRFLSPDSASKLRTAIRQSFESQCGGTEATYKEIQKCLLSPSSQVPSTKEL